MTEISRYLDHAVLKPDMTTDEVAAAIELGLRYKVRTVCVRPSDIHLAKSLCAGSDTTVITVLAFPHGCTTPGVKELEAIQYIEGGVSEIDMVANYGLIRSHEWEAVERDIAAVVGVARQADVAVKVILETNQLSNEETWFSTLAALSAGADFVKTSTGFNGAGATVEAVSTMLEASDGKIKVKASGGIRSYGTAMQFIDLGVHRLGVGFGSTEAICTASAAEGSGY